MAQLKSMQVAVPTHDLKGAANFYIKVLGFHISGERPNRITLEQENLRLSLIKAEPGAVAVAQPLQVRFTVAAPQQVDDIARQAKGFNIPLLEDVRDQPDAARSVTFLDPDGHVIEISSEPRRPLPAKPLADPYPQPAEVEAPVPPTRQPTRGDRYLLEAQERLARIKEELASLSTAFSQSDIAATLEEMKEKVARRVSDIAQKLGEQIDLSEADRPSGQEAQRERERREEGLREQRRRETEEALALYKQQVHQQHEDAVEQEEEGLKPARKTLGPASDDAPPDEVPSHH